MRRSHMYDVKHFINTLSSLLRGKKGQPPPNKWKMLMGTILSGNEMNTIIVEALMKNMKTDHQCYICENWFLSHNQKAKNLYAQ